MINHFWSVQEFKVCSTLSLWSWDSRFKLKVCNAIAIPQAGKDEKNEYYLSQSVHHFIHKCICTNIPSLKVSEWVIWISNIGFWVRRRRFDSNDIHKPRRRSWLVSIVFVEEVVHLILFIFILISAIVFSKSLNIYGLG
jgi:hypothetical protein